MKSVAASLYNFLDDDQNGKVNFKELLVKIYPNLAQPHIQIIEKWINDYATNFNVRSQIKDINKQDDKKRVLPKVCLKKFKEMFQFYDKKNKGYIEI